VIIFAMGRPGEAMSAPVLEPLPSNTCPQCHGAGYLDDAIECPNCYGHGEVFQLDEALEPELRHVLCQDCLAVLPYTDDRHQEREFCSCGGQLCGCDDCHAEAVRLLSVGQ
jgi:RecJ-like exonuclease